MQIEILAAVCAVIVLGAVVQRVTGMGFALLSAPFLVILLGPRAGVIFINIAGVASSLIVLMQVWRAVEWRRFLWLGVPAVIGTLPGALLVLALDTAWLEVGIGVLLVGALAISIFAGKLARARDRPWLRIAAGFSSGVASSAAGTSGPPISVYAVTTSWEQRAFAATVQPYFVLVGTSSVVLKMLIEPQERPDYPWWVWLTVLAAMVVGTVVGRALAKRIPSSIARTGMLVLAMLGSLSVVVHGATALLDRL